MVELDIHTSKTPNTPTLHISYLEHGALKLTDSMPIVRYIGEKSGQEFISEIQDLDRYCLANTLLDTAIDLFLLDRSGIDINTNLYTRRKRQRIELVLR